jgi:hypothetical protein
VTVKNQGNLLDVVEVKLYGKTLLNARRFEIKPGETRTYTFEATLSQAGTQDVAAVVGQKAVSHTVKVSKASAK